MEELFLPQSNSISLTRSFSYIVSLASGKMVTVCSLSVYLFSQQIMGSEFQISFIDTSLGAGRPCELLVHR